MRVVAEVLRVAAVNLEPAETEVRRQGQWEIGRERRSEALVTVEQSCTEVLRAEVPTPVLGLGVGFVERNR